jgi:putative PIN family toxin of toxin-antitoxin system
MRVVIDSNVIISASLIQNSTSAKVVRTIENLHIMIVSEAIIEEFSRTILKSKFDKYFKPLDTRIEIISRYSNKAEWVVPEHNITICRDPKDNKYLELALSGKADCIISGDSDLLILNPFENIPIVTPKEFLDHF